MYWTSVFKKVGYLIIILTILFVILKLAVFYMPFLFAFILSLIIEPIIKWLMKNIKISRKLSSIIVFIIVFGSLIGLLIWLVITIASESANLLASFNQYYEKAYMQLEGIINKFDYEKIKVPIEVQEFIENTAITILQNISKYLQDFLTHILKIISSIPTMAIYFVVFVLALYFICTDKIYILDEMEHHFPEKWVKKIGIHLREIIKTLGRYLKSQVILILISFIISIIGLYIMQFIGLNIRYPLLIALGIGFVDALPILGSGTVMVPWAVISGINGDLTLGISIIVLWIIMSVTRQFIEPKIVSRKYWNTPNIYNYSNVYRI